MHKNFNKIQNRLTRFKGYPKSFKIYAKTQLGASNAPKNTHFATLAQNGQKIPSNEPMW